MANLFLSYAQEDFDLAQKLYYALINLNHAVFFDKKNLQVGNEYNFAIIDNIRKSDFAIFLISPDSCSEGSYCRTELKIIESNWPVPNGKLFPVWARETDWEIVPNYLKSISILKTEGNLVAETIRAVQDTLMGFNPSESISTKIMNLEIEREIELLDLKWSEEKKAYLIETNGKESIPTTAAAAFFVTACMVFALLGYLFFSGPNYDFFGPYPVLLPTAMGIFAFFFINKKAKDYQQAERKYIAEKNTLLERLKS